MSDAETEGAKPEDGKQADDAGAGATSPGGSAESAGAAASGGEPSSAGATSSEGPTTSDGADGAASSTGPAAAACPQNGGGEGRDPAEMSVGELVFEVSDRASVLVREEIELAKTEITEKFNSLLRGSVTALAAGVFVLMALAMIMNGLAWLLDDLFFPNDVWAGFLIEAALFLIVAAIAGLVAKKLLEESSPPTPDMAIEQAKEIKASFESGFESKVESKEDST